MYRGLIFAAAVLLALGSWWYFKVLPESQNSVIEVPQAVESTSQWQWDFQPAGENPESGAPKTNVTLRNGGTSYAIGVIDGSCFDIAQSEWELLTEEGELAGAICWWAGGGTEIGVFSEGGRADIRVGQVDEGTAEGGGMRGGFQTLFSIDFGFVRSLDSTKREIVFDDALWLSGETGENAAIAAGLCTEETRADCLPNDFYIYNDAEIGEVIPLASNITVYMLTWNAGEEGIKRQFIPLAEFTKLINDSTAHWNKLPYNVSIKNGEAIMIEEVYVP
jgi:hypothetical protein